MSDHCWSRANLRLSADKPRSASSATTALFMSMVDSDVPLSVVAVGGNCLMCDDENEFSCVVEAASMFFVSPEIKILFFVVLSQRLFPSNTYIAYIHT